MECGNLLNLKVETEDSDVGSSTSIQVGPTRMRPESVEGGEEPNDKTDPNISVNRSDVLQP